MYGTCWSTNLGEPRRSVKETGVLLFGKKYVVLPGPEPGFLSSTRGKTGLNAPLADTRPRLTLAQIDRRNYYVNLAEGALFIASLGILSVQTVLPALVVRLGGSNLMVGALSVIFYMGASLPQIFAARFSATLPWKRPWAILAGTLQRIPVLFMALVILIFGGSHPELALPLFMVTFALGQIAQGISAPGWFDFYAKITSLHRRGRLSGLRNSVGGVGAFLAGILFTLFLGWYAFPTDYGLALLVAFLLQLASILLFFRLIEVEPSPVDPPRKTFAYMKELPGILKRDAPFRRFLVAAMTEIPGMMPVAFFTAYALKTFAVDEAVVGLFTLIMVAFQVLSALVSGFLVDRFGNKVILVISSSALFCASLLALLAPNVVVFSLVFAFVGINLGPAVMARLNISVEFCPVEKRSTYVGLMNTMLAPFYLAALAGGVIADLFGYELLFGAGMLFAGVGATLMIFTVRDPRWATHADEPVENHPEIDDVGTASDNRSDDEESKPG
jgi:MFS family permease